MTEPTTRAAGASLPSDEPPTTDRRRVLALGGLIAAGGALAATACAPAEQEPEQRQPATPGSPPVDSGASGAGIRAEDVPVAGGVVLPGVAVVTQPEAGQFKAFSPVCTHQGCEVGEVSAEGIVCPCHFSVFSITDGAVVEGPAEQPLAELPASEADGMINIG
ncbi:Rieske Fe-S protein [Naumannella cuiyingiana]|uniref:Cytochrome bc1 complex Rieske iron-sulfur subunit n=1 Tax=Naumannella cuiyingiana TaxID=1347891 RepID=A0A7Z0IM08_9ACTN|nr:Rieske (2Fe-2S) protein [Naumannella cuiyingiana]NYI72138.1 Rieske Fe-S protein [Naumannella cuiyingiana]